MLDEAFFAGGELFFEAGDPRAAARWCRRQTLRELRAVGRGASGEVVWRFQTVHHDIWDYDVPSQPTLYDVEMDGRRVRALAQTTKMGYVFLLDRETGEPNGTEHENFAARLAEVPGIDVLLTGLGACQLEHFRVGVDVQHRCAGRQRLSGNIAVTGEQVQHAQILKVVATLDTLAYPGGAGNIPALQAKAPVRIETASDGFATDASWQLSIAELARVAGASAPLPFPRMTWDEAMDRFGSDRPDLRWDLEISDWFLREPSE